MANTYITPPQQNADSFHIGIVTLAIHRACWEGARDLPGDSTPQVQKRQHGGLLKKSFNSLGLNAAGK